MRARLLDDHQRLGARLERRITGLCVEPRDDQLAKRRSPHVAVAIREEVAGLIALDLVEDRELGVAVSGGPCQRDRPPDAEVMPEVGVVDRNRAVELREHAQQPRAPTARRAEDPDETILAAVQTEAVVPRWLVHLSAHSAGQTARPRYPLPWPANATAPAPVTGAAVV